MIPRINMSKFLGKILYFLALTGLFFVPLKNLSSQNFTDAYKPFWYLKGAGAHSTAISYNSTSHAEGINGLVGNPALLGEVQKTQASFSILSDVFNQKVRLGYEDNYNNEIATKAGLDNIGIVYPIPVYRGSFVIGVSYTNRAIYNYISESSGWEYEHINPDTGYYLTEEIRENGRLNSLNLGGAMEVSKDIFVGLGFHLYNGERDFDFDGYDQDRGDFYYYKRYSLNKDINTDYNGWNFSFGSLYRGDNFKWGVKLSTPLKLNATEDYTIDTTQTWDYESPFDTTISGENQEYSTKLPMKISTGISLNISNVIVSMDLSINNWDQIEFDSNFDSDGSIDQFVNESIALNLTQTVDYGVGLILPFTNSGNISLGYRLIGKPLENLTSKYQNLDLYSAGLNYQINNFEFELGYQMSRGYNNESHFFYTDKEEKYRNHRFAFTTRFIFD